MCAQYGEFGPLASFSTSATLRMRHLLRVCCFFATALSMPAMVALRAQVMRRMVENAKMTSSAQKKPTTT